MRIEDDGITLNLILEDTGEIARMLMAMTDYNRGCVYSGSKVFPRGVMLKLENCMESE